MGPVYARWMQDFSANGGTLLEHFNDTTTLSEWGPWGTLPTIYSPNTPRYDAVRTAAGL